VKRGQKNIIYSEEGENMIEDASHFIVRRNGRKNNLQNEQKKGDFFIFSAI
jgi:hypothetical protein